MVVCPKKPCNGEGFMADSSRQKIVGTSTVPQTTAETIIRIGGTTAGGAVVGGAIGSMAGPIGTVVGSVIGGASGLFVSTSGTILSKSSDPEK